MTRVAQQRTSRTPSRGSRQGFESMATRLAVDSPSGTLHSMTVAPWAASPSRRTLTRGCAEASYVPKNRRRIARNPSRADPPPTIGAYRGPVRPTSPTRHSVLTLLLGLALAAPVAVVGAGPTGAAGCAPSGGATLPSATAAGDVVLRGGGWGHGLGMSQYGAQGAARLGCSASEILARYYAGTTVAPAADAVADPAADARQRLPGRRRGGAGNARGSLPGCVPPATATPTRAVRRHGPDTHTDPDAGRAALSAGPAPGRTGSCASTTRRTRRSSSTTSVSCPATRSGRAVGRDTAGPRRVGRGRPPHDVAGRLDLPRAVGALGLDPLHRRRRPARRRPADRDDATGPAMDKYLWGIAEVPSSFPAAGAEGAGDRGAHLCRAKRAGRRSLMPTPADQNYTGCGEGARGHATGAREPRWRRRSTPPLARWSVAVDRRTGRHAVLVVDRWPHRGRALRLGCRLGTLRAVDDSRWDAASSNPAANRSWAERSLLGGDGSRLGFTSISAISVPARGSSARTAGVKVRASAAASS